MGSREGSCCFGNLMERNWHLAGLCFLLSVLLMAYPQNSLVVLYYFLRVPWPNHVLLRGMDSYVGVMICSRCFTSPPKPDHGKPGERTVSIQ